MEPIVKAAAIFGASIIVGVMVYTFGPKPKTDYDKCVESVAADLKHGNIDIARSNPTAVAQVAASTCARLAH